MIKNRLHQFCTQLWIVVHQSDLTAAAGPADLMTLQAGAAFWSQHKVTSERAWQAERQALHADYKAKHRAAAKHVHNGHRRRLV